MVSLAALAILDLRSRQGAFERDLIQAGAIIAQNTAEIAIDFIEDIEIVVRASAQGAIAGEQDRPNVGELELFNLLKLAPPVMSASVVDADGQERPPVWQEDNSVSSAGFRDVSSSVAFQRALIRSVL